MEIKLCPKTDKITVLCNLKILSSDYEATFDILLFICAHPEILAANVLNVVNDFVGVI